MLNFNKKLKYACSISKSFLVISIEPYIKFLPEEMQKCPDPILRFCIDLVDSTAPYTCAYKIEMSYFHSQHSEEHLEMLCYYIRENYPDIVVILDSNKGTNKNYIAKQNAIEAFERYQSHAIVLSPYFGKEQIQEYLIWEDRGIFIDFSDEYLKSINNSLYFSSKNFFSLYKEKTTYFEYNLIKKVGVNLNLNPYKKISLIRNRISNQIPIMSTYDLNNSNLLKYIIINSCNSNGMGILINFSLTKLCLKKKNNWREILALYVRNLRNLINIEISKMY